MIRSQKSPERGAILQRYLVLHSQHDALQKYLNHITNRSRPACFSSLAGPEDNYLHPAQAPLSQRQQHRSGSTPTSDHIRPKTVTRKSSLPTVIDESILGEIEEAKNKLKNVKEQIKCTLTDLLSCEGVRGDKRYRMWVQAKLMDAEKELEVSGSQSQSFERIEDVSGRTVKRSG